MKLTPHILAAVLLGMATVSCRGGISKSPPVHLVLDMDFQQKLKPQSESSFAGWADHRGMRLPVAGTVARGSIPDPKLVTFKDGAGGFLANPLPSTRANLERGRSRYDIYCTPCHDRAGSGYGAVYRRARLSFAPPPDLASHERIVPMADGEIYQTIANGRATMPAYGHMLSPKDRWCIVHYIRALQYRLKN